MFASLTVEQSLSHMTNNQKLPKMFVLAISQLPNLPYLISQLPCFPSFYSLYNSFLPKLILQSIVHVWSPIFYDEPVHDEPVCSSCLMNCWNSMMGRRTLKNNLNNKINTVSLSYINKLYSLNLVNYLW